MTILNSLLRLQVRICLFSLFNPLFFRFFRNKLLKLLFPFLLVTVLFYYLSFLNNFLKLIPFFGSKLKRFEHHLPFGWIFNWRRLGLDSEINTSEFSFNFNHILELISRHQFFVFWDLRFGEGSNLSSYLHLNWLC
jgi:hypothetical protein